MVKNTKRPVSPEDLKITPPPEDIPVPLVLDGEIIQENLDYLNRNLSWLEEEFKKRNLSSKNVLYACLDCQGNLYISKKGQKRKNGMIIA